MLKRWVEKGMFPVNEQRLLGQKNNIITRNWLTDLKLEEIGRNIEEVEQVPMPEELEVNAWDNCNTYSPDRSNEDEEIDYSDESKVSVNEEEKMLNRRLKEILSENKRKRLLSLRGVEKERFQYLAQKGYTVLSKITTNTREFTIQDVPQDGGPRTSVGEHGQGHLPCNSTVVLKSMQLIDEF